MDNDIKEILDIIKKVSKAEVNSYNGFIETPPMKWEIFLDYITNLQEENKTIRENNLSMQKEMCMSWKKSDDYESRCEKAIEVLESYAPNTNALCDVVDNAINILKGE